MGQDTAEQASRALRLLNDPDLRHHPQTGPQQLTSARAANPSAPVNLDLVDYMSRTVKEVVDHTRTVNPDAGPVPQDVADIYTWCLENTPNADEAQARYRDFVIERQRLEHAVRLGNTHEVSKHPCPRCGCWGLMWPPAGTRALCSNRNCLAPDGRSSTWTLARLAAQTIQRTEIWRRTAT
ncbi:hypothetical protein [Streptomyces bottropensis]|uniref:hypothetical protein n=1 Tax=Streptomyces bottropensis TaxID=42235 RepID=UPI00369FA8C0